MASGQAPAAPAPRTEVGLRGDWVRLAGSVGRYPLRWLGAAAGLVVVWLAVAELPLWWLEPWRPLLEPKDFLTLLGAYRTGIAQMLGGMFVLAGAAVAYRQVRVAERSVEVAREQFALAQQQFAETAATAQRTLALTERGQVTERFTKAIDQLGSVRADGSPNLEIRLGGIYALEEIGQSYPAYYWTVMDVLTAYVRQRAPWPPADANAAPPAARTDVQAALRVLGRRRAPPPHADATRPRPRLDLRAADLREAELYDANLWEADLWGAHLERARLWGARLMRANLVGASCDGAEFMGACLDGADLTGARFDGAVFHRPASQTCWRTH
jgi:DNA-binding XRE family transcriptional regulator